MPKSSSPVGPVTPTPVRRSSRLQQHIHEPVAISELSGDNSLLQRRDGSFVIVLESALQRLQPGHELRVSWDISELLEPFQEVYELLIVRSEAGYRLAQSCKTLEDRRR